MALCIPFPLPAPLLPGTLSCRFTAMEGVEDFLKSNIHGLLIVLGMKIFSTVFFRAREQN